MDLRFDDHGSFQRAAAGMVGGALLFGAALHPVTPMAPLVGGSLGVGVGVAIGYGRPVWRLALAVVAAVIAARATSWGPLVGATAAVLSLAWAAGGPRGARGLIGMAIAALATGLAMWSALSIAGAQETSAWPPIVASAVSAAGMGIVATLGLLPRHVHAVRDPVRLALAKLPTALDAEVRGLCTRAVAIWDSAQREIADASSRELVRDGVVKALEVAARSAESKAGASDAELAKRIEELDQRIAAASDAEVKAQYEAARAAVEDQRGYRARIRQGRERLVARMHNHVAALEKFELAATGLPTAARAAAGASAMAELEGLSQDVTASGDALAEVELAAG